MDETRVDQPSQWTQNRIQRPTYLHRDQIFRIHKMRLASPSHLHPKCSRGTEKWRSNEWHWWFAQSWEHTVRCQKLELAAAFAPQTLLPIAHFISTGRRIFVYRSPFSELPALVHQFDNSMYHLRHSFSNRNLRLVTKWANWWYRKSGRSSTNNHCVPLIRHVNQIVLCLMCHSAPHIRPKRSVVRQCSHSQRQPFPVDNFAPKTKLSQSCTHQTSAHSRMSITSFKVNECTSCSCDPLCHFAICWHKFLGKCSPNLLIIYIPSSD